MVKDGSCAQAAVTFADAGQQQRVSSVLKAALSLPPHWVAPKGSPNIFTRALRAMDDAGSGCRKLVVMPMAAPPQAVTPATPPSPYQETSLPTCQTEVNPLDKTVMEAQIKHLEKGIEAHKARTTAKAAALKQLQQNTVARDAYLALQTERRATAELLALCVNKLGLFVPPDGTVPAPSLWSADLDRVKRQLARGEANMQAVGVQTEEVHEEVEAHEEVEQEEAEVHEDAEEILCQACMNTMDDCDCVDIMGDGDGGGDGGDDSDGGIGGGGGGDGGGNGDGDGGDGGRRGRVRGRPVGARNKFLAPWWGEAACWYCQPRIPMHRSV